MSDTAPVLIDDSVDSLAYWPDWKYRPFANDDTAETNEDRPITIDVLGNDKHAVAIIKIDGQYVKAGSSVTLASNAVVTLNADGTLYYDPNGGFEVLDDGELDKDSFSYTAYGRLGTDKADVTVTVAGITDPAGSNLPPVAVNDVKYVPYYDYPYPQPLPLETADVSTAELDAASADGPIYTTLAIGEEGDPYPSPSSVTIDVLANDYDPDNNNEDLTIGEVNGKDVVPGEPIPLKSGATLTISDDLQTITYSGGILSYGGYYPPYPSTNDSYTLIQESATADATLTLYEPIVPLPLPYPKPILADVFKYRAFDGQDLSENEAYVTVIKDFPYYVLDQDASTDPAILPTGADTLVV